MGSLVPTRPKGDPMTKLAATAIVATAFVAIQSHSPSNNGSFVRFDYRFERNEPTVLEVLPADPIMITEEVDDPKAKGGKRTISRPALPSDDVFFSLPQRQKRAALAKEGKITEDVLELLAHERAISIRPIAESEINAYRDAQESARGKDPYQEIAELKRDLAKLQAQFMAQQFKPTDKNSDLLTPESL